MGYSRKKKKWGRGYGIPRVIEEIARGDQESGMSRGLGFRP